MPVVKATREMKATRALVATAVRTGNAEDEARYRREYDRLVSASLRAEADRLDRKHDTA
jgi:hypothetical protein